MGQIRVLHDWYRRLPPRGANDSGGTPTWACDRSAIGPSEGSKGQSPWSAKPLYEQP
jgi:hypothetical protein